MSCYLLALYFPIVHERRSVTLLHALRMPRPLAICGVCLVATQCFDDRKFVQFGRDFVSGQGNTHCCAQNAASAKQCRRIAMCTTDELRRDAAYGARLRDYATTLEASVRRYLKREMLPDPSNLRELIESAVADHPPSTTLSFVFFMFSFRHP